MLENKLNPFIKTKGPYPESCLQVAARWGFLSIVQLFLKNVDFTREKIEEVLFLNNIPNSIRKELEKYISLKFKKEFSCFSCFNCI